MNKYLQMVTWLLLSISLTLQAATDCAVQTDISPAECDTLIALYTDTGGASWTDSPGNGWNQDNSPCSWTGVTCSGGRVTEISRTDQNLLGTIPDLSALTGLQKLWLNKNQLSGSIPDLSALTGLLELSFTLNQLSGTVPDLSALTSLQVLRLNQNQLTGTAPDLSTLPALTDAFIGANQFTGSLPDISALTNLVNFAMAKCQLTGTIPDLSAVTNLNYFDVSGNQLSGTIPALPAGLTTTNLGYNAFTAETGGTATTKDPNWADTQTVPPVTGLSAVTLSDTQVQVNWDPITYQANGGYYEVKYSTTPGGPYGSGGVTADKTVGTLTVDGLLAGTTYYFVVETYTPTHALNPNDLRSIASAELTATTTGTALCATQSDILPAECETLAALYTSTNGPGWTDAATNNWFVTTTPCSWTGVTCGGGRVTEIIRTNQNLLGTIPDLSALTGLQRLRLNKNQLSGNVPDLSALTGLTELWLQLNQNLTGNIDFSALSNLLDVRLDINQFSGPLTGITSLTNLTYLSINQNQFSGTLLDLNSLSGTLEKAFLTDNQFTGTLPDLSTFANLNVFFVSNNQLTGTIPDISGLTSLIKFGVNGNQLSGTLPDVSGLTNLQSLLVRDNQLSGTIPDLSALSVLDGLMLRGNQFSGTIPTLPASLTNTDLGYNAFTAAIDGTATTEDPDWADTQTVPTTTGLSATPLSDTEIQVNWTPITYQADGGYYEVKYSTTSGSGYVSGCTTADKTANTCTVTGLLSGTTYYFIIETFTPAHVNNQNALTSIPSAEMSATTTGTALCVTQSDILPAECETLAALYTSTNGASWTDSATNNWFVTTTPCSWTGVGCTGSQVGWISRSSQNLSGSLPDLSALSSLQGLYLGNNQITGSIPDLSALTNLVDVYLGNNQLTGSIPNLSSLTNCHIAIDCKICYLKNSSISEDILALLRTKKQGTKGEE